MDDIIKVTETVSASGKPRFLLHINGQFVSAVIDADRDIAKRLITLDVERFLTGRLTV